MIRILVLALVAANLLYLGWSQWIRDEQPRLVAPPPAAPGTASAPQDTDPPAPPSCTTLGPFSDDVRVLEFEQVLHDMQLLPSRRAVTEDLRDGWWVYVVNADARSQSRALRAIQNAGMRDAFVVADDPEFRVSVGLFSDEDRARSRAAAVTELQLNPTVSERTRQQTAVWLDLPETSRADVDMARLASEGLEIQDLRVEDCPGETATSSGDIKPGDGAAEAGGEAPPETPAV